MASKQERQNNKQFRGVTLAVTTAFKRETTSQKTLLIALKMREQIIKRSRLGKGLTQRFKGKITSLPALSRSYEQQRANRLRFFKSKKHGKVYPVFEKDSLGGFQNTKVRVSKKGKITQIFEKGERAPNLGVFTTPNKSNLTATGQLLESLRSVGLVRKIIISVKKSRKGDIFDKNAKSPINNHKLIGFLEAQGRMFLGLSKSEQSRFERELGQKILKEADKIIKKTIF